MTTILLAFAGAWTITIVAFVWLVVAISKTPTPQPERDPWMRPAGPLAEPDCSHPEECLVRLVGTCLCTACGSIEPLPAHLRLIDGDA